MLKIYDIAIDEWREATQEDIDRLQRAVQAYGRLRMGLEALAHVGHNMATGRVSLWDPSDALVRAEDAIRKR